MDDVIEDVQQSDGDSNDTIKIEVDTDDMDSSEDEERVEQELVCDICCAKLKNSKRLRQHKTELHDDKRVFVCQECGIRKAIIMKLKNIMRCDSISRNGEALHYPQWF